MNPLRLLATTLAATLAAHPHVHAQTAGMAIGQNLDTVNYYSSSIVFVNNMKASSEWLTREVGTTTWDSKQSAAIPARTTDGYPEVVPFPGSDGKQHFVHNLFPIFENGQHRLIVEGKGTVQIAGPGVSKTSYTVSGTLSVLVTFSGVKDLTAFDGGPSGERNEVSRGNLEISVSDVSDPIRNIRIMRPGFHNSSGDSFDPAFKARAAESPVLRMMDWMRTNDSPRTKAHQPPMNKSWYTQGSVFGVSMDHIIDLVNEIDRDVWICIPHQLPNSEIQHYGYRMANRLKKTLKCYVEYSNEVWNPQFNQDDWVNANVAGNNLPQRYGTRAKAMFDIFTAQFNSAGHPGLVRVLAGQSANDWHLKNSLITAPNADVLAIAPYFGTTFSTLPSPLPTLDDLAGPTYNKLAAIRTHLRNHRVLADANGKKLVAYEGGQHYVGSSDAVKSNTAFTNLLLTLNRDWRMRNLYRLEYLPAVNAELHGPFMNFTYSTRYSRHGSWGSMEWLAQPIGTGANEAGKEWALRDWKAANP